MINTDFLNFFFIYLNTGLWKKSMKHGKGVFTYRQGHEYDGEWYEDKRHGKGKMTFLKDMVVEESYDGDWVEGSKHGMCLVLVLIMVVV
jgi:hypothetical protein